MHLSPNPENCFHWVEKECSGNKWANNLLIQVGRVRSNVIYEHTMSNKWLL